MEDDFYATDLSAARVKMLLLDRVEKIRKSKLEIDDRYPFPDLYAQMGNFDREYEIIQKTIIYIDDLVKEMKAEIASYEKFNND